MMGKKKSVVNKMRGGGNVMKMRGGGKAKKKSVMKKTKKVMKKRG